jgi:lipopolysaccharide transport system ATP-binding protein
MALRSEGCTLVFCSHDLHAVGEVCDRVLWLRDGHPAMLAAAETVLKAYEDHVRARNAETNGIKRDEPAFTSQSRPTENYLREVALSGDCRDGHVETGGTLKLRIIAHLTEAARRDGAHVVVLIVRNDGVWCYGIKSDGLREGLFALGGDDYGVTFVIERVPLLSGLFSFTVALMDSCSPHAYDYLIGVSTFTVRHEGTDVGVMRIPYHWERP